jgi:hypothetical protein
MRLFVGAENLPPGARQGASSNKQMRLFVGAENLPPGACQGASSNKQMRLFVGAENLPPERRQAHLNEKEHSLVNTNKKTRIYCTKICFKCIYLIYI